MSSRVGEVLLRAKLVDELQVRSAMAKQNQWGGRLAKHIVEMGFAEEGAVADALAKACGLQRINLGMMPKDPSALAKVEVAFAEEKGVFPYALRDNGKTLWVAMADPCDIEVADTIAARCGCRVRTSVAGEREIVASIYRHYKNQMPPGSQGSVSRRPTPNADLEPMDVTDMQGNGLDVPASRPTPAPFPAYASPPAPAAFPVPRAPTPAAVAGARKPTPHPWDPQPRASPTGSFPSPAAAPSAAMPVPAASPARPELPAEVAAAVPPAVAAYLSGLHADLEKTSKVLRGLIELCVSKRIFSNEEIKGVIARLAR